MTSQQWQELRAVCKKLNTWIKDGGILIHDGCLIVKKLEIFEKNIEIVYKTPKKHDNQQNIEDCYLLGENDSLAVMKKAFKRFSGTSPCDTRFFLEDK